MKNKNIITGTFDLFIRHKNIEQFSRVFNCNKIEFIDNHLMVYKNNELIFKVWLKLYKFKKYKNLKEAMKDVGIDIYLFSYKNEKQSKNKSRRK